ncbi:MAG: metal-sensitive transcriptional regulator [Actinobacteria bacterium]|jgi:DNA-binding FrmR family transcriptional regulator|nr:metal-sensitive transcriptional regulator [Actinomycetota bacterium]MCL6105585.1 metal-sensitive transcriptional regulator [Actinomycetota bacterium]
MDNMKSEYKDTAVRRLQTSVGHLQAVLRMVEQDTYCPEIMKQISAIQGSLEQVNRIVLRNHLETCVATAMREGRDTEIVNELMAALKFEPGILKQTNTSRKTDKK